LNLRSAILITYPNYEATEEAISLAEAAGYTIQRTVTQRNITRSKFGIGKGKAEEVRELIKTIKVDCLIFDEVLKPTQQYNLTKLCETDVVDRERLILEIFEKRASTEESRIQIKLAQLHYDAVRIKEKIKLARKGEQPGFFGLGKYDVDVSTLYIKNRISVLKKKLIKEEKRKQLRRTNRANLGFPTISIAGYTSAGKTTLFNLLSGESKAVAPLLFTTLSTSTRAIEFKKGKAMISDTIGFINKLPAYVIDAFRSTLEELYLSDLILLVVDISRTKEVIEDHLLSCIRVLNHMGINLDKVVYVLNKADSISFEEANDKLNGIIFINENKNSILISAKKNMNINSLLVLIESKIFEKNEDYS
jgi:GTP-binding protein HflX